MIGPYELSIRLGCIDADGLLPQLSLKIYKILVFYATERSLTARSVFL